MLKQCNRLPVLVEQCAFVQADWAKATFPGNVLCASAKPVCFYGLETLELFTKIHRDSKCMNILGETHCGEWKVEWRRKVIDPRKKLCIDKYVMGSLVRSFVIDLTTTGLCINVRFVQPVCSCPVQGNKVTMARCVWANWRRVVWSRWGLGREDDGLR